MSATDAYENKILDHVTGNTPFVPPDTLWLGLAQATDANFAAVWNSLEAGNFTYELTTVGTGYSRQPITFNPSTKIAGDYVAYANKVIFPIATTTWTNIRFNFIADAQTGGNILFWIHSNYSLESPVGCRFTSIVNMGLQ